MHYRDGMSHTLFWSDGYTWTADDDVFTRVTHALDETRTVIEGADAILTRWHTLSARSERFGVDDLTPTEGDRAIFTAALARARETHAAKAPPHTEPTDRAHHDRAAESLDALHQLFVTDITQR